MDLALDLVEVLGVMLFLWIVLFIPMPGVNSDTSITVIGDEYDVSLLEDSTLPEGDYTGSHDIMSGEIRIATGWTPTFQFMTTCSHEVQHLEFEIEDKNREDPLTTEEEHERMSGFGDKLIPWNWEHECLGLLDNRFNLA